MIDTELLSLIREKDRGLHHLNFFPRLGHYQIDNWKFNLKEKVRFNLIITNFDCLLA